MPSARCRGASLDIGDIIQMSQTNLASTTIDELKHNFTEWDFWVHALRNLFK